MLRPGVCRSKHLGGAVHVWPRERKTREYFSEKGIWRGVPTQVMYGPAKIRSGLRPSFSGQPDRKVPTLPVHIVRNRRLFPLQLSLVVRRRETEGIISSTRWFNGGVSSRQVAQAIPGRTEPRHHHHHREVRALPTASYTQ